MNNFLDSITRKGRRLKEQLKGKKGKRDESGADTTEGGISSSSSFLRPVPPIAAGGHDGEGSRPSTDTRQVRPESTTVAATKLLFRGVRDSADAFGPLKSVAGGLCFILENYEVRYVSLAKPIRNNHMHPSEQRRTNRR